MLYSNTNGVKENKYYNKPVKPLLFYSVSDPKTKTLFGPPKSFTFTLALHFRFKIP